MSASADAGAIPTARLRRGLAALAEKSGGPVTRRQVREALQSPDSSLPAFARSLRSQGYRGATVRLYTAGAADLLVFLGSRGRTPATITTADLTDFRRDIVARQPRGRAANTLVGARRFLSGLAQSGLIRPDQVLPALNRLARKAPPMLPPSLGAVLRELDDATAAAGFAADTRTGYRRAWRDFLVYLADVEGVADLAAIDRDVMTNYRVRLQSGAGRDNVPLSSATQHAVFAALRFFFGWLVRTGKLLSDPTQHLPPIRISQTLPRVPKPSDLLHLIRRIPKTTAGVRDRAALELLYGTGMRGGELVRLDMGDVDFQQATIFIREGKGSKDRIVPLGKAAREALVEYLDVARPRLLRHETAAVFLAKTGARLTRGQIGRRLRLLGAHYDLPLWPHLLRHACATHLLRGRADIRQIQRLLGHKNLSTTERYTRVEVSDLRAVVRRCHPREKKS